MVVIARLPEVAGVADQELEADLELEVEEPVAAEAAAAEPAAVPAPAAMLAPRARNVVTLNAPANTRDRAAAWRRRGRVPIRRGPDPWPGFAAGDGFCCITHSSQVRFRAHPKRAREL